MKKGLSLLLALVMCLSLCACGGGNDIPKTTEATAPEEVKMSKDEMLNIAIPINLDMIGRAFEDNKVNAQETYFNRYYTIVGEVYAIEVDHVIIRPISAVFGGGAFSVSKCTVKLSTDEIKTLSREDVIEVCGKLTDFEAGYQVYNLTIEDAFFVSNEIKITAEVNDVNNYAGGKKSIVLKQVVPNGSSIGSVFFEIVVAESGAENSEEAEYQGAVYKAGDKVTFTGVLKTDANMGSNYYNVVSVRSISKN